MAKSSERIVRNVCKFKVERANRSCKELPFEEGMVPRRGANDLGAVEGNRNLSVDLFL